MLGENDHGAKLGSDFPYEARVGGEPSDITFITAVYEDGPKTGGSRPVLGTDQVPLRETRELGEAEMVESLPEISGLVMVRLVNPSLRFGFDLVRKFAKEARDTSGQGKIGRS